MLSRKLELLSFPNESYFIGFMSLDASTGGAMTFALSHENCHILIPITLPLWHETQGSLEGI